MLDLLLLGKGDSSFFFVQDSLLLSKRIFLVIIDTNILQIQRLLDNLIGVDPVGAVGLIRFDIGAVIGLVLHIPLTCDG